MEKLRRALKTDLEVGVATFLVTIGRFWSQDSLTTDQTLKIAQIVLSELDMESRNITLKQYLKKRRYFYGKLFNSK